MLHKLRTRFLITATLAAATLITGCASSLNTASTSEFSCSGQKDCPTPFEVYNGTNSAPNAIRNGRTPLSWGKNGSVGKLENAEQAQKDFHLDLTRVAPASLPQVQAEPPAQPIREPSQVMRIWVAPWIDQGDNLNWTGYIYTEVTPKRWTFGEQEIRHQGMAPQFMAPQMAR